MLKVLLVNDTPRHLGRLRDALTAAGCLVVGEADNAFILADQVAQLAPDAIIVDTESPSRDTLEQVCVLSQSAPHPIVMFTDDGGNSSIRAAIQAGVTAYVVEGLAEARILPILQVAQARFEEEQRLRAQVSAAEARLAERKTIERAKGILMKSRGFSEAEATMCCAARPCRPTASWLRWPSASSTWPICWAERPFLVRCTPGWCAPSRQTAQIDGPTLAF